jgi:hypothetical protein
VITFDDGSEPIHLVFDHTSDEEEAESDGYFEEDDNQHPLVEDDEELDAALSVLSAGEEDERIISFLILEKANHTYRLDDGINPPNTGVVASDGLLTHAVSPLATGCTIQFEDEVEVIELEFAPA